VSFVGGRGGKADAARSYALGALNSRGELTKTGRRMAVRIFLLLFALKSLR
jgi:hypothetical protein